MRKVAYEQWRQQYPDERLTRLNLRYAGAVLKLLTARAVLDETAQLQLLEEFGVPSQEARGYIQQCGQQQHAREGV